MTKKRKTEAQSTQGRGQDPSQGQRQGRRQSQGDSRPEAEDAPRTAKPQTLQVMPLGGVGRIGMNAMLVGCGDDWLLLDCGVMFPEPDQTGVELVLPSLSVLGAFKSKIRAIVLTHGHEDHIGALPYALKVLDCPVYATRFTSGLIQHKLREHALTDKVDLHIVRPGMRVQIGPFDIGFLRVTHSIPDCVSLAIRSPGGNMLFTGDFKIEDGIRDNELFDYEGFKAFGDEGVDLMMSDSTNAEVPGWTGSEASVGAHLREVFGRCKGRILVGLFASNIYRVHEIIDAARHNGRYCATLGKSLERYIECANSFTNIPFDAEDLIDVKDLSKYDDNELVILCTGSQGEPRAALARLAIGAHPEVSIKPTDTVVLSSRQIPGNERRIHQMLNDFARRGAHVIYPRTDRGIHVSGHACQDELKKMLSLVRPRNFIPVHGEYTFLQTHADMARALDVPSVTLIENGHLTEVGPDGIRNLAVRNVEPWYGDGMTYGDADMIELKAREQLAWNGVVAVEMDLWRERGVVTGKARVRHHGVYHSEGELEKDAESMLQRWLGSLDAKTPEASIEGTVVAQVRRVVKRFTPRKPVVLAFARWHDGAPKEG